MTDIAAAVVTVGFLALAAAATFSRFPDDDPRRHRRVNRLIGYTIVCSLVTGVLHIELWPFSRWSIFSQRLTQPVHQVLVMALDRDGGEHDVDRRAFEPFTSIDLYTWLEYSFRSLSPAEQREAAQYLLDLINAARARALAGQPVGRFDRYFGRFSAPVHIVHAPIWDRPADLPRAPFAGLRVFTERWNVFDEQQPGRGPRARELIYELAPGSPP